MALRIYEPVRMEKSPRVAQDAAAQGSHTSSHFQSPKANKRTATRSIKADESVLTQGSLRLASFLSQHKIINWSRQRFGDRSDPQRSEQSCKHIHRVVRAQHQH